MKILITGGAGFIGSHLAERLTAEGHQVTVFDRAELPPYVDQMRGIHEWVKADCRDIQDYFDRKYFDFVYHLAATVGVKRVLDDPSGCIANNIDSLRAVLSLGVPGLFTSTSEVYGKTAWSLKEDSSIKYSSKSRWSYAASKLIGEWMCQQAGWKSVRLFNVIGPRQSADYGAVLPQFVKQAISHEPLTIYGEGKQVRTFIDVRDCVEVLDHLRDKDFDVVNVGGAHIYSIQELADVVADMHGRPGHIRHIPYETAYPKGFEECQSRVPHLEKLDRLLPARPLTSITKTIADLAESIRPSISQLQNR